MQRIFTGRFLLPALAALGLMAGVAYVVRGNVPAQVAQPVAPPSIAPYQSYIAGAGMIEASTRNIAISTPVGGVVTDVFVHVGNRVSKGQPLFEVDTRDLQAQLAVQEAAAVVARDQIAEAAATLAQARNELKLAEALTDRRAISAEDMANRRYAVQSDEAKLSTARASADSADEQVQEIKAYIARSTITAPVDGDILQVNVLPGQYAQTGVLSAPLIVMGDTQTLHVRVDVDENDAWRFKPGMPARGFVRGNSAISFDLHFAYVEPYVVPKAELTGESTEQVDTRVLQVVYSVRKGDLPIYVGQQIDVYIKAPAQPAVGQAAPPLPPPMSGATPSTSLVRPTALFGTAAPPPRD
jgi:RND family efflux transporter MFP subunit